MDDQLTVLVLRYMRHHMRFYAMDSVVIVVDGVPNVIRLEEVERELASAGRVAVTAGCNL